MTRRRESLDQSIRRMDPKSPLGKLALWRKDRDAIPHHPLGLEGDDFRNLGDPDDYSQKVLLSLAAGTVGRYLWSLQEAQGGDAGFDHAVVDGREVNLMPRDKISELTETFDRRTLDGLSMGPITRLTLRFVLANTYPAEVLDLGLIPGPTPGHE